MSPPAKALTSGPRYGVEARFVEETAKLTVVDASVQLWIPRRLEGCFVTENATGQTSPDNTSLRTAGLRQPSVMARRDGENHTTSRVGLIPEPQFTRVNWDGLLGIGTSSSTSRFGPIAETQFAPVNRDSLPPLGASSRGGINDINTPFQQRPGMFTPPQTPRAPAHHRDSTSTLGSARSGSVPNPWPANPNGTPPTPRPQSIAVSTRSTGSDHTTTVSAISGGGAATGLIHTQPQQPLLVLFTKDPATGAHALAAVLLDTDTQPTRSAATAAAAPTRARPRRWSKRAGARAWPRAASPRPAARGTCCGWRRGGGTRPGPPASRAPSGAA